MAIVVPDESDLPPLLQPSDLEAFATIPEAKAVEMIADALAIAATVAPCVALDTFTDPVQRAAVKSILRGAVLRWNDSGSGAAQTQSAGPFAQTLDTRQARRGMFWPSEIEQLQAICRGESSPAAFSITPATCSDGGHLPWCNLFFGAPYCSCGADIGGGVPLFEGAVLEDY